ncbi:MAG: phosphocholine cytidylyltransferase family protein [Dehalococcoidia bacterium]|nr:phosphocholine cytidylyltransferase family protein [Dehalococcoidia bacterium]
MPTHPPHPPARAVILAAGIGGRMGEHTADLPKPLVALAGRPLIAYTIEAIEAAGIPEVVVVTGFREAQLRTALAEAVRVPVRFASNPHYLKGASLSLAAARDFCRDEPFVLTMSDHIFGPDLIHELVALAAPSGVTVAADARHREEWFIDEATRLNVVDGRVDAIGKGVTPWTHLDAGAFVCSGDVWPVLDEVDEDASLSDVFSILAARNALYAADVTGTFWFDVDTPEDYLVAERILLGRPSALA